MRAYKCEYITEKAWSLDDPEHLQLVEDGFNPSTSGPQAQHASAVPLTPTGSAEHALAFYCSAIIIIIISQAMFVREMIKLN